eukprot:7291534-Pyramimonas_sp.AAC.1
MHGPAELPSDVLRFVAQAHAFGCRPDKQRGEKNSAADRSELHCVHVMVADGVPVACKPGFSEGVPELARFMRSNTCRLQRSQTEIVLCDSPEKWGLQDVQKLFPNVKSVGGDPLHAWMHLA